MPVPLLVVERVRAVHLVRSVTAPEEDAGRIVLSPSDRFAVVGKTGTGKTTFTAVLAGIIVPPELRAHDWQVWVLDTKGDPKDIARLQKLGYVEGDVNTGKPKQRRKLWSNERPPALLYFRIRRRPDLGIAEQSQHLLGLAFARRRVLTVIDEFTQVILGPRTAGPDLDDIFTRGRGLGVGMIGNTQEPVDIPRKLLSQAQHLFLFDLSFERDIKYMRDYVPDFDRVPPNERHAFTHVWIDGDARPRYYPNLRAWRSRVLDEGQA